MTTTMATAQWAMVRQAMMTMMIATSEDDDDDDGDGATGDEVDNDGNGATGDGAMGYNDNNDSFLLVTLRTWRRQM